LRGDGLMRFTIVDNIRLIIPARALEVVFDECDRYAVDETGGRILGVYEPSASGLTISVTGIIEPGPSAQRTGTYLKQDGAYQEQVFRQVEAREPTVEHLGNWHTHHVNGLRHLSGGDVDTYRRIVGHQNHNTDFFYALLVVEKHRRATGLDRYAFKHYVLRRGDPAVYEIAPDKVTITDASLMWPLEAARAPGPSASRQGGGGYGAYEAASVEADAEATRQSRVYDRDLISQFYPKVKAFQAEKLGLYWRGAITLVDGSEVEAVVLEDAATPAATYKITLRNAPEALAKAAAGLGERSFPSSRAALVTAERACNAELFGARTGGKRRGKWMF
jgi:hypothetical protein